MKALILAAGLGTRLRPLTSSVPKVLVPLGGKTLLEYHLQSLNLAGINEILINTHYLSGQINDFIKLYSVRHPGLNFKITYEPELLGSAGTLAANRQFFCDDEALVIYGDNFTNFNYSDFFNFHRSHNGLGTIAVYHESKPESKGIAEFDGDQLIRNFVEKPKPHQITTNYANAGIYLFNPKIFDYLLNNNLLPFDFGHHVFPRLLKQSLSLYAYPLKEYFLDIGTMESYNKAQAKVKQIFPKNFYDHS